MSEAKPFMIMTVLASLAAFFIATTGAFGQGKPQPRRLDLTKSSRIEKPTEAVVGKTSSAAPLTNNFVNPKVQPGKVLWHPTFAAACEASRKSGKPVMLFHMMGKLDDRFC